MVLFGGTTASPLHHPTGSRPLHPGLPGTWAAPGTPAKIVSCKGGVRRTVAVIGTCGATSADLARMAEEGVPDTVVTAWAGSYCVIESTPSNTTLWTDVCAALPIYLLTSDRHALHWACSSRVLASKEDRGVEPEHLALRLESRAIPAAGTDGLLPTHFTGVHQVPGGHRLTLSDHGTWTLRRVWKPRPRAGEHTSRFRSALEEAVAVRFQGSEPVSVDLSGGFDSSALTLIAANKAPASVPVFALTVHPTGVFSGGDLDYVREVRFRPGMRHEYIPLGPAHTPLRPLPIPPSDEPPPSATTYAVLATQLSRSRSLGCRLHMTGDGGDSLLSTPMSAIGSLFRAGHWVRALREYALAAQLRQVSWSALWHDLSHGAWHDIVTGLQEVGRSAHSDAQLAETHGVALHNPYTDSSVVDAYLSLPEERLPSPSRYKPVLAACMADLFPSALARRTTKGSWSTDHHQGLRYSLPRIRRFLFEGHVNAYGLVSLIDLDSTLARAAAGLGPAMSRVERMLSMELWLRALAEAPPIVWTTTVGTARA